MPAEPKGLFSLVGASNSRHSEVKDLRKAFSAHMTFGCALDDMFQHNVRIFFDVKESNASAMAAEKVGVSGQAIIMVSTFGQCRMMETRIARESVSAVVGPAR